MADFTGLSGLGGLSLATLYNFGGFTSWDDAALDLTYGSGTNLTGPGSGVESGGGVGGPPAGGNPGTTFNLGGLFNLGGGGQENTGQGPYGPTFPIITLPPLIGGGGPTAPGGTVFQPPIVVGQFPPSTPPTVTGPGFPTAGAAPSPGGSGPQPQYPQQPQQSPNTTRVLTDVANACTAAFVVLRALLQNQQPPPDALRIVQPYIFGFGIPGGTSTVFVPGAPAGGTSTVGGGGGYVDPTTGQFVPGGFLGNAGGGGFLGGCCPDEESEMRAELAWFDDAGCSCEGG